MPIVGTRANASARGYGWSATIPESLDGMVLITPSSVVAAGTGSSASIVSDGSIEFSTCTSISLNDVFSADYDNYIIQIRDSATANDNIQYRLRVSGTDNSTASSYTSQRLNIEDTIFSIGRGATTAGYLGVYNSTLRQGYAAYFYGPYLTQKTVALSKGVYSTGNASMTNYASTHNQSTSYTGITIIYSTGTGTGLISVYGLEN